MDSLFAANQICAFVRFANLVFLVASVTTGAERE